ncbi:MAG: hypothetical protein ACX939_10790 [Hyphococcus sp.]
MPTAQQTGDFCFDHVVTEDGAVAFRCSDDEEKWPWLVLHPANNVVVQIVNYFALTSISDALGRRDPDKWTALTSFAWRVFDMAPHASQATHGQADPPADEEGPSYAASFFTAAGDLLYRVHGKGVVFRNRDFEAWRAKSKAEALASPAPASFAYAPPDAVGVATSVEALVSPLQEDKGAHFCDALITRDNGFPPGHPYHDGSGDHVNSGHLCDAAQQCAMLVRGEGGRAGYPSGGEAVFKRYVELERPFRITLASARDALDRLVLTVEQGGKVCADITFVYHD